MHHAEGPGVPIALARQMQAWLQACRTTGGPRFILSQQGPKATLHWVQEGAGASDDSWCLGFASPLNEYLGGSS